MDHESSSCNHIMMLLKEMVDVAYRDLIDMMDAARRALREIIDMEIHVGQWLLDKLISLLGLVQQGIEEEFNQTIVIDVLVIMIYYILIIHIKL